MGSQVEVNFLMGNGRAIAQKCGYKAITREAETWAIFREGK